MYLGQDANDDGKVYVLNDGIRAKTEVCEFNWTGQLSDKVSSELKSKSQEAEMPRKITHSLDKGENPSADKYNMYDKEIAVATHLFNRELKKGNVSFGNEYELGEQATLLDVNLVKALAYKESRLGQGVSQSTEASDIFSMFNIGDYGSKSKMGMTKSDVLNGSGVEQSLYWWIRWLYFKSMVSPHGKIKNFSGWDNAVQRYGPGKKEKTYKQTVMDSIYNTMK